MVGRGKGGGGGWQREGFREQTEAAKENAGVEYANTVCKQCEFFLAKVAGRVKL